MEQERSNLMKQADQLKKRDDSIENLMDKYRITSPNRNVKNKSRGKIMDKIKQRMSNIEKGKSIEILESKRGREQRLNREKQDNEDILENEGGEKEGNSDGDKEPSQHEIEEEDKEDDGDAMLFEDNEELGGDQAFNPNIHAEDPQGKR